MKKVLLLVVISSFAIGMVGCKGEEAEPVATTPAATAGGAGTTPPPVNPTKAGGPQVGTAPTPELSANANDPRWKAGSMLKGSEGK
jgi:hypothetical protein